MTIHWHQTATYFLTSKPTSLVRSPEVNKSSLLGGTMNQDHLGIKLYAVKDEPNSTPWTVTIQRHQTETYFLTSKPTSLVHSFEVNKSSILGGEIKQDNLGIKLNAVADKPNLTPWTVTIQWHQMATYFLMSKTTSLVRSSEVNRSSILWGTSFVVFLLLF